MPDLNTLASAHALADEEEPHDPRTVPPSGRGTCANCGAALVGRYCADCGQLDQPLRLPVHRFLIQSFNEFFGIDGRVWTTLGVLLFKPGKLTAEYLQGRRRRYLRPLRVYLTSTLVFFILLALLDPVGRFQDNIVQIEGRDSTVVVGKHLARIEAEIAEQPERLARQQAVADSLQARADSLAVGLAADVLPDSVGDAIAERVEAEREAAEEAAEEAADGVDDLDSVRDRLTTTTDRLELEAALLRALPADSTVRLADIRAARAQIYPEVSAEVGMPEWLARSESVQRIQQARTSEETTTAGLSFARSALGHVPTVLFLVLPVFALLLKVLYVRRGWYYSEHLVFGLHTHAFAFCVFTLMALLAVASGGSGAAGTVIGVLALAIPVYFLAAQKRVYGQGWIKTILKSLVLGWTYVFVLVAGLIGVLFLAAALG